ncbi:hypothetical protein C8R44DRAFT_850082, partial [Mycena epipterygia]
RGFVISISGARFHDASLNGTPVHSGIRAVPHVSSRTAQRSSATYAPHNESYSCNCRCAYTDNAVWFTGRRRHTRRGRPNAPRAYAGVTIGLVSWARSSPAEHGSSTVFQWNPLERTLQESEIRHVPFLCYKGRANFSHIRVPIFARSGVGRLLHTVVSRCKGKL